MQKKKITLKHYNHIKPTWVRLKVYRGIKQRQPMIGVDTTNRVEGMGFINHPSFYHPHADHRVPQDGQDGGLRGKRRELFLII